MSLNVKRQQILGRVLVAIARAKRDGGMIAVDVVAASLLAKNPDCSTSLVELREEIARLAIASGVDVEFGSRNFTPRHNSREGLRPS